MSRYDNNIIVIPFDPPHIIIIYYIIQCYFVASTPNLQIAGYGICSLPGCNRPKYQDPANGRIHYFCGRTHASQAKAQGVYIPPTVRVCGLPIVRYQSMWYFPPINIGMVLP